MHVGRSELLSGCTVTWADGQVTLAGDIDELNADTIADRLSRSFANAATVSTLDLTGVLFFSAAGVRMLAKVAAAACMADTIVHVTCSPTVWRIADLCGGTELPGLVLDAAPDQGATR